MDRVVPLAHQIFICRVQTSNTKRIKRMHRATLLAAQTDSGWVHTLQHQWFKYFFLSPLMSQLRVVLGQQRFNVSGPNTRTFGVEKYFFPKQFSVFNPTLHDIGNPHWTHAHIPMTHVNYKTSCPHSETHFTSSLCAQLCVSEQLCPCASPAWIHFHIHTLLGVAVSSSSLQVCHLCLYSLFSLWHRSWCLW